MFLFLNFQYLSKSFQQMKWLNTIFVFKIEKKTFFQFSFLKSKSDPPFSLKSIKEKSVNILFSSIQNPNQASGFVAKTLSSFFFSSSVRLFISAIGVINLWLLQFICLCYSLFFFFSLNAQCQFFFSYFIIVTKKQMKKKIWLMKIYHHCVFFFCHIDLQWIRIMIDIFEKIILYYNAQRILFTKLISLYTKKTKKLKIMNQWMSLFLLLLLLLCWLKIEIMN